MNNTLDWDYTQLAVNYDKRPDYSTQAIDRMFTHADLKPEHAAADLGAGTGKLTQHLLRWGLMVTAVEPNQAMHQIGKNNFTPQAVTWVSANGEATGLSEDAYDLVCFGSSFNVMNRRAALIETARILKPGGWFACLWNHRDLNDPLQAEIEAIIQARVPDYQHGIRRTEQTEVIHGSGLFGDVYQLKERFSSQQRVEDQLAAWRSHATLARQAGEQFDQVIEHIQQHLHGRERITVPYHTRIWYAQYLG